MHIIEINDENGILDEKLSSKVAKINEIHKIIMTFTESLIWIIEKYFVSI